MITIKKLYFYLNKISGILTKILECLGAILIFTCALTLFFQVLYRFVIIHFFSFSFPFTEEYARYALIWSSYFVVALCYKEGSMASVNFVYDKLVPVPKMILYLCTRVLIIIFLIIGIQFGIQAVKNNLIYRSPTLRLPGVFIHSSPLIGCSLLFFEVITELLGVICGEIKPFTGRTQDNA